MVGKKFLAAAAALIAVSGCAQRADKVAATYTPSVLYNNLTCQQLVQEGQAVSNRAHTAVGKQNRHRVQDDVIVTAGIVVFWPALFFTHGNDASTAELAQLKGEMNAIEAASASKNCGIVFNKA